MKRILSISLIITILANVLGVLLVFSQYTNESEMSWRDKLSAELLEVMETSSDYDLIPIWLRLRDTITPETIRNLMIEEYGMDPEIYRNERRFREEIVQPITQKIIEEVGYEEAHRRDEMGASLISRAINAEVDRFIIAHRGIVARLHSTFNNNFIAEYVNPERRILLNSLFTSTLILEATKAEIKAFAKNELVGSISLYRDLEITPPECKICGEVGCVGDCEHLKPCEDCGEFDCDGDCNNNNDGNDNNSNNNQNNNNNIRPPVSNNRPRPPIIITPPPTNNNNNNAGNGDIDPAPSPERVPSRAEPTAAPVLIDGENAAFQAYHISGHNFFRLRDVAYALNGTAAQFNVVWNGENNVILLTIGESYEVVGGEMVNNTTGTITANPTSSTIFVGGISIDITAFYINGNNFFMLRDLGAALGFGVEWDEATETILINTN